jgi:uncharacterized protein (DUF697 family)
MRSRVRKIVIAMIMGAALGWFGVAIFKAWTRLFGPTVGALVAAPMCLAIGVGWGVIEARLRRRLTERLP